ncbi:MAG: hypothetical protein IJ515_01795 [Clostridia bacterium]|nr:hypothetical protein [Clostridia bacterium]
MKKILSLLLVVSLLLGTALALSSCGAPDDAGAVIPVYLGDAVYDFDPTDYYADANAEQLMSLIFEPLFTVDDNGKLGKAAVKKYDVDEEERLITIELRETYWSDGTRVMGEDFIYAWRDVLLNPAKPNPAAALLYDIENAVEIKNGSCSAYEFGATSNLYEITITYREGADYEQLLKNLASVATSPLRQAGVSQAPTYWAKSSNSIFTNGPFSIARLDYESGEFTLTRNLGYHQPPTKVDYDNNVTPYELTTAFKLDGNKVSYSYEDLDDVVFFMSDAPLSDRAATAENAEIYDDLSTYTYVFDTTNPIFADKNVRKALSMAIDRNAIISAITYGRAATGFVSPLAASDIAQALISASADMAAAKELVNSSTAKGASFTLTVNNDEQSKKIAEIVEASWEELGFDVTVKVAGTVKSTVKDFATGEEIEILDSEIQYLVKEASYGNVNFDVIAVDWQMYSNDPFVALAGFTSDMNGNGAAFEDAITTVRTNISGWTNAKYDSYIEAAYEAGNAASRNEYLKKAEALLIEEAPVVPLVFNQTVTVVSDELRRVEVDGFGNYILTEAKLKNYEDYLPTEE